MGRITVERQLEIALAVFDADEFLRGRWVLASISRAGASNDRWLK